MDAENLINFVWMLNLRIPDLIVQKYQPSHGDALKALTDKVGEARTIQQAITNFKNGSGTQTGGSTNRTMATPEWDGEGPINTGKRLQLTGISMSDFEAANTPLE